MAELVSEIINLGPCTVTIDDVDQGLIATQAKVTIKQAQNEVKVAKAGDVAVKKFSKGTPIEAELDFAQTAWALLVGWYHGATKVTGSGLNKLTFGQFAGKTVTPHKVVLTPVDGTATYSFTMYAAIPTGDAELVWDGNAKEQVWKTKWEALVDLTRSDGDLQACFGDPAASADVVAPTLVTVTPAEDESGVSKSTTVIWVFSEAIAVKDIVAEKFYLAANPESTGNGAYVAGALTYSSDFKTVTFTPTSALGATTNYIAVATKYIHDTAGNAFAGSITAFVTTS